MKTIVHSACVDNNWIEVEVFEVQHGLIGNSRKHLLIYISLIRLL